MSGVPQDSQLRLLLFLVYINDIVKSLKTWEIQLFANDKDDNVNNKGVTNRIKQSIRLALIRNKVIINVTINTKEAQLVNESKSI